MSSSTTPTWNEALSGVFGSVSLAAWIFLLVPQVVENYRQGSAEGISITFLLIWAAGDALNLAGALWAGLVPTVIALAVYFCFADSILILQCFYYMSISKSRKRRDDTSDGRANGQVLDLEEETPLLVGSAAPKPHKRRLTDVDNDNVGLPGSRRRSSAANHHSPARETRSRDNAEEPERFRSWLKNSVSVLAIFAAGSAGWAIAWRTGLWHSSVDRDDGANRAPIGAEILGYGSAVLYLGARVPQIVKNQRQRSCEGLSLLFFILSIVGNATYGAGILFHSVQKSYILINLPWLIGSLGTMIEDAVIFAQFSAFGEADSEATRGPVE